MAISRSMDNRDKELRQENVISLKHFPPKLRKLGKYLLQLDKKVTIKLGLSWKGLNMFLLSMQEERA